MHTQETLRRVEQNDPTLPKLCIVTKAPLLFFFCCTSGFSNFSRLGECIGDNFHTSRIGINLSSWDFNMNRILGSHQQFQSFQRTRGLQDLFHSNWKCWLQDTHYMNIPKSNYSLHTLGLYDIIPIMLVQISQSLTRNNTLKEFDVGGNLTYKIQVYISKLFCNKTSQYEHSTYASNHTLEYLDGVEHHTLLNLLLEMNRGTNKSHVAMKKVLRYHPNVDMRQCLNGIQKGKEI